ncbi:MAG: ATP-dependent zinc metalloprotease FtsH [Planctomycetes bacterium]|jgi:cell division protease FtsH|nr:ATP-dependent zinc metalloprotease FtsH [Planctomycetota bacterium]
MTQGSPDNNRPSGDPNQQKPNVPPPRYSRSLLGWVVIIALCLLLAVLLTNQFDDRAEVSFSEFETFVDNNQLTGEVVIEGREIRGEVKEDAPWPKGKPRKFSAVLPPDIQNYSVELTRRLKKVGSTAQVEATPDTWWDSGVLINLLLMVGLILLIWFFLFRRISGAAGGGGFLGSFGRSRHRVMTKEESKVTFENVAGIEEAKDEVSELVEFLKNPKKFSRLGGRVPRGVLLVGEPGCGKTLLAKAIAGEAEVPFFSISGSDFVEMFVGVGASRVRDLFKQAKDTAPCIIFLDEIDAVGRKRGMGFNGGGHDEREQTLNAILVEMDGFESSDQVIVIAATNRADVLDPALTRPGRFDRQIQVPLPDLQGRLAILKIYAEKVRTGPHVDLNRLARGTPMFSGADLEAIVNEAAISAALNGQDHIEHDDLEEARDKVRWGRSRKSRVIDEKEKTITAYHEAGHAIVQELVENADPLHKVSIIPRGPMGGATFSLPEKDRYLYTRRYCNAVLQVSLAGRIAEALFCDDISSGAQNDIAKATELAKKMALDWGMSDKLGMINYSNEDRHFMPMDTGGKDYSERTAEVVDGEVRRIIDDAWAGAERLLKDYRDALDRLAKALMKYETLSAEDVRAIIDGKTLDKPTVEELLQAEQAKDADRAPGSVVESPAEEFKPEGPPPMPEMG